MLFTKPIRELTHDDIVNFCNEGHSESSILEYKSQVPDNEKLAKTISAFANTYGGVLVIGVNASSGKPEPPFEGFTLDASIKYEEKIESVCLAHIKEPIFPEIQVCPPKDGKTFIVVRVAESSLTPHRVANNTKIYVRTGQSSTPNEEADWNKIEWLASRRQKSIELRERLKHDADQYFLNACELKNIKLPDKDTYFAILSLKTIPMFPQTPLVDYSSLENLEDSIEVRNSTYSFPPLNLYHPQLIQNGIQKLSITNEAPPEQNHGKAFRYLYLNSFGVYSYKEDIGKASEQNGKKLRTVHPFRILANVYYFLFSAIKFYHKIGFFGNLQLETEMKGAFEAELIHPLRGTMMALDEEDKFIKITRDNFYWTVELNLLQLTNDIEQVAVPILHEIFWSLGVRYFTKERILKAIEKYPKP